MPGPQSSLVLFRRVPARLRRRPLQRFARLLRDQVAGRRAFTCLIADDRELRRLNRRFRGKDYPTDVLSFPETDSLGELAVSWQRADRQARAFGHSLEQEIRLLMLHGVLHLRGMDHETDGGRMAGAETRWRTRLGLPGGLIARARR
jgi:probable rRNA maturation factor